MKRTAALLVVLLLFVVMAPLYVFASSNNFINALIPPEVNEENSPSYTLKHMCSNIVFSCCLCCSIDACSTIFTASNRRRI